MRTIFLAYIATLAAVAADIRDTLPTLFPIVHTSRDLSLLLARDCSAIEQRIQQVIEQARLHLQHILELPADAHTFETSFLAMDSLEAALQAHMQVLRAMMMLPEGKSVRQICQQQMGALQEVIEKMHTDPAFYELLKAVAVHEQSLNQEQQRLVDVMLGEYRRQGFDLSVEKQQELQAISQELSRVGAAFDQAIMHEVRTVIVSEEELDGVGDAFLSTMPRDEKGNVILRLTYPVLALTLGYCHKTATRKTIWLAYRQHAYPQNEKHLDDMIALRDRFAKILGYASYAHYALEDTMAQSPERVCAFLEMLEKKARPLRAAAHSAFYAQLPESVTLNEKGLVMPWDAAYLNAWYKKQQFDIDEREIAEYFELNRTLAEMFKLYETFFGIRIVEESQDIEGYPEVGLLRVEDEHGKVLGYVMLDLFARAGKRTLSHYNPVIPALITEDGGRQPAVGLMAASFIQPSAEAVSYLSVQEVSSFFHEFGHALHGMFGATQSARFSGTNVQQDFVEVPSQMLECWLDQPEIIALLSAHHKTGEPLSEEQIQGLMDKKRYGAAGYVMSEIHSARLALEYFAEGEKKDRARICKAMHEQYLATAWCDENHHDCSFDHLYRYDARYYGYLWSKVFALDLFDTIKKAGMGPEVGKKYVAEILSKGGSVDPNQLLKNFLGREPTVDAFFSALA